MQPKKILILIIIIIIIAAGLWTYYSNKDESVNNGLSEIPDIVAYVNNEDITKADLEISETQLAAGQGIEIMSLDDETRKQLQNQALDILISSALIEQAAANLGITASEDDINSELKAIKDQFEDDAKYQEALSQQGMSESDLRSQIVVNIVSYYYINQVIDIESIKATEEEINALYEQEAAITEELPPLAEVYDQIESFIIQQKQQELFSKHIQELRALADIKILI